MDQNQAQFLAQCLCKLWEGEFPATCKVLAAVPDDKRGYRPDEKSRSAWELATHIATSDIWFVDSIEAGKFVFDPAVAKERESGFGSIDDVVAYYKKEFPAALGRIRAMPADKLAATVDFFGMMQMPSVTYLGLRQQPLGASSRPARCVSPRDGIQSARDLRRQRRRADVRLLIESRGNG